MVDPLMAFLLSYNLMFALFQARSLSYGVDVICATPGRLNDHLERRHFVS